MGLTLLNYFLEPSTAPPNLDQVAVNAYSAKVKWDVSINSRTLNFMTLTYIVKFIHHSFDWGGGGATP